jgi:hypothetical protein
MLLRGYFVRILWRVSEQVERFVTAELFTAFASVFCAGSVSIGFMHATPGDMKSFKSSADRIALMAAVVATWTRRRGQRQVLLGGSIQSKPTPQVGSRARYGGKGNVCPTSH